ncbi:MAG: signal recognition particle protein [Chloroflexi bacterium]|nr:signal recognition particle protein [Chloroflexota bacterium]
MFEILSEKIQNVLNKLGNRGVLTEKDVDEALREVRLALLEADVNFKVVKGFLARVKERAIGADVLQSLTPGNQVVKIVNEELISILGGGQSHLTQSSQPPTVAMLVGLQGSGKTTTAAKLARHLKLSGQRPLLVAADVYRPAAITQLVTLGKQLDIPVHSEGADEKPARICANALKRAREVAATHILIDTAGRLHIDENMMKELTELKALLRPAEVLLVVDAMTGQDAVRTAEAFNTQVGITGLILTKMDGDARGGAALSIRSVTGIPIKFIGVGEKMDALQPFYPDRLASRILGMGDVLTLIEKAEIAVDDKRAKDLERKMREASLDLEDFLEQLRQLKKMGPLQQILELVPGLSRLAPKLPADIDEQRMKRTEAIILSMTPAERRHPEIIDGSRRRRIARGSGTTPQDINQLLNQFRQMQKLLKQYSAMFKGKPPKMGQIPDFLRR